MFEAKDIDLLKNINVCQNYNFLCSHTHILQIKMFTYNDVDVQLISLVKYLQKNCLSNLH